MILGGRKYFPPNVPYHHNDLCDHLKICWNYNINYLKITCKENYYDFLKYSTKITDDYMI